MIHVRGKISSGSRIQKAGTSPQPYGRRITRAKMSASDESGRNSGRHDLLDDLSAIQKKVAKAFCAEGKCR